MQHIKDGCIIYFAQLLICREEHHGAEGRDNQALMFPLFFKVLDNMLY